MSVVVQNFAAAIEGWFQKRDLSRDNSCPTSIADVSLKSTG